MTTAGTEARFYTDEEVDALFSVTSSKLRTAQRYGLVESYNTLQRGRYIRVWDELSAARAYIADLISEHLAISFQVSCSILMTYNAGLNDLTQIKQRFIQRDSYAAGELPRICLGDRRWVYLTEGSDALLGELSHDETNRMIFVEANRRMDMPAPDTLLSSTCFDVVVAGDRFRKIADA